MGISWAAEELLASQKYTGTESWFVCCLFVCWFVRWLVPFLLMVRLLFWWLVVCWLVRLLVGGCLISEVGSQCSVLLKKLTVAPYWNVWHAENEWKGGRPVGSNPLQMCKRNVHNEVALRDCVAAVGPQLFTVPPHCVMPHVEAATIGGLLKSALFLARIYLSVCLSLSQPSHIFRFVIGRKISFVCERKQTLSSMIDGKCHCWRSLATHRGTDLRTL